MCESYNLFVELCNAKQRKNIHLSRGIIQAIFIVSGQIVKNADISQTEAECDKICIG